VGNVVDALVERHRRLGRGAAPAVLDDEGAWTYDELSHACAGAAGALRARGVGPGDRVAVVAPDGRRSAAALLGAVRLGAIAVPLDPATPPRGMAAVLADCAPAAVVSGDPLDGVPAPVADVGAGDLAWLVYTSGTTGRPKGAMLSHLGICHSAIHYECCMALTASDRAVVAVPMSHVTGVIALVAAMVRAAAALIVMPAFKAREFLELAARERMTHSLMVPAMYNLCLLDATFDESRYAAWRVGAYGGAPMAPATIARFAESFPS
jgi:long-chain acyl-CoA synthetase